MARDFITIRERVLFDDGKLLPNTYSFPSDGITVRLSDENGVPHIEDSDGILPEEYSKIQFPQVVVPTYENGSLSSLEIVLDSNNSECETILKEIEDIIKNPSEYYGMNLSMSDSLGDHCMYLFELETFQNSSM